MAIDYNLINKGGISLGTNFELLSDKPLDSRLVVPSLEGLQNYIDNAAVYEGMIVYDKTTKKSYQVQEINNKLDYIEFGININGAETLLEIVKSAETNAKEARDLATRAVLDVINTENGLILTKTEDNKISVDWDSNTTFIFNSGSADIKNN